MNKTIIDNDHEGMDSDEEYNQDQYGEEVNDIDITETKKAQIQQVYNIMD